MKSFGGDDDDGDWYHTYCNFVWQLLKCKNVETKTEV